MLPGPIIIRQCSSCKERVRQFTIGSGNMFGARFWTDAKIDAPMLPDQPELVKCPHCGAMLWIKEELEVAILSPWDREFDDDLRDRSRKSEDDLSKVPWVLDPTLDDYIAFLEHAQLEKAKERYVRIRVWWLKNDARRDAKKPKRLDRVEVENLRALVALLDEADQQQRIMKAEALRELGEFEPAEKLLSTKFEEKFEKVVSFIRDLNRKRIWAVKEMIFE